MEDLKSKVEGWLDSQHELEFCYEAKEDIIESIISLIEDTLKKELTKQQQKETK